MLLINAGKKGTGTFGGGYSGPSNVASSAPQVWYGLRGVSTAYSTGSNPSIDIVDQAGANSLTVNILSSGALDVASIATWVTAHTVSTIKVAKIYDQAGGGFHLSQATLANMPVLTLSALGSLPGMTFAGGQNLDSSASASASSTGSFSAVAKRTVTSGFQGILENGLFGLGYGSGADQILLFQGSVANATATDSSFHAIQAMMNAGSSSAYVDGSATSGLSVGTNSMDGAFHMGVINGSGDFMTGVICEAGFWTGQLSGGDQTALNSNQRTYWGF